MTTIINASSVNGLTITPDTSGQLAFQSNGGNTITVPQVAGTMVTTGSPQSGSVIQVVSSVIQNNASYFSTASTSFVSTGFSITITPKFSTSKIVLLNNATVDSPNTNLTAGLTIYRNGTNLATGTSPSCLATLRCSSGYADVTTTMQFVDSPATTSALTYTVYAYASSATMYYGISGGNSSSNVISFIAMEIAA